MQGAHWPPQTTGIGIDFETTCRTGTTSIGTTGIRIGTDGLRIGATAAKIETGVFSGVMLSLRDCKRGKGE